jgi:hypothetical protein
MARIITQYDNKTHDGNGYLHLDFDVIKTETVTLDMEVVNVSSNTETIWKIYSNNVQLDTNDLTKAKKAELKILKSYAGSNEAPHIFNVIITDLQDNVLAKLDISVFSKPKITEAYWGDSLERKIYEVAVNHRFTAHFKGFGLYNIPLTIRFFLKSADDDDVEITDFAKTFRMTSEYDLNDFCIDYETLKDNYQFFLRNAPTILSDYISGKNLLSIRGKVKDTVIAKSYFIISYENHILFHGTDQNKLLNIVFNITSFSPPENIISLSPVTVAAEEYFTQKYEPCKYERVYYKNGDNTEQELFDEKKPTKKDSKGVFKNNALHISAIVPPRDSKNIKELKIRLEAVKTENCSLSEQNKKLTTFSEDSVTEQEKLHKGRVINTEALDKANIEYSFEKLDEKIIIKPSFDYKYDKSQPWEFMKNYFLFSSVLRNTDVLENEIKGVLMDAEADKKGIVKTHRIGLETCRYQKGLYLHTYADVAWAFHGFYNKPVRPRYYMDDEHVIKREGLDDKITWVQNYNQYFNLLMPVDPFGIIDSINDFILELLKDMAKNYGLAFTAYYDFNEKGKCEKRIEYAEQYPNLFDGFIAGAVTLEILVQILLLIVTEGASAELLLARMSKAGVKMSGKLEIMAKKAERNIAAIRKKKLLGTVAKVGHTIITTPSVSYYKGYRFAEDEEIGIQPLLEERMAFSPLFGIDHEHKKNLGDLVYEKTPVYKVIDLSQKGLEFLTIGFNRHILMPFSKDTYEAADLSGLSDHYLQLLGDSFGKVNEYLAFVTAELIEKVFGTKAEYSVEVKGGYGMDFELKIHNAEKKLNLTDFLGKGSVKDASVATIGSNKELNVEVKIDANVKVPVRAMNIINYMANTSVKEIEAGGKFEISTGIFLERRFFFHANEKKPYYKDSIIFTGVAGKYGYAKKIKIKRKGGKIEEINKEQKSKIFVLLPVETITYKPIPLF